MKLIESEGIPMREIVLGKTGIRTVQNAFGVLPLQRTEKELAVKILHRAYEGGIRFYDTARDYTDSEEKLGAAFSGMWDKVFIASKTHAGTPEGFWKDLETSLGLLKTDCLDLYQLHQAKQCYRPGDGSGLYECMLEAKAQGKIRHIGLSAHRWEIAMEAAKSGLYETVQFPFSYLSSEKDAELVRVCAENNVGFIAMKGLAGGLITHSDAAMAFMTQYDNVLPIWGIQRESELEEWLSYMDSTPEMTPEMTAFIEKERKELAGNFCRACGYCLPCSSGIVINQCARMSLLLRRMPSAEWLSEKWQNEMKKIENCIQCGRCASRCPYGLDTPELLKRNYEDYKNVLAGKVSVD